MEASVRHEPYYMTLLRRKRQDDVVCFLKPPVPDYLGDASGSDGEYDPPNPYDPIREDKPHHLNAMLSWQLTVQTSEKDRTTFTFSRGTKRAPWYVEGADLQEAEEEEAESDDAPTPPIADEDAKGEEEEDSEEGSDYERV